MPEYKYPALTADAVIQYKKTNIILIRRKNPPFQGKLALPGGFIDKGETPEEACIREAKEETNLDIKIIKRIGIFSGPHRDPRGLVVTVAFLCEPLKNTKEPKAQDDAAGLEIISLSKIPSLDFAFDHRDIIKKSGIVKKLD
jgi:8-oxo-dGTP diphosphatase